MRSKLIGLFAGVMLAASACSASSTSQSGSSNPVGSADDPIVAAMQNTLGAGSASMTIQESTAVGGQSANIQGSGQIDFNGQQGTLNLQLPTQLGGSSASIDMVFKDSVYYMKSPVFAQILPPDKTWVKMDLKQLSGSSSAAVAQFAQLAQSDPSQFVDILKGSVEEHKVGTEKIDGEDTSRYGAKIDYRKAAKLADDAVKPSLKAAAAGIKQATGDYTVPIDVWIDSDGRVRREKVEVAVASSGVTANSQVTVDFTDYGTDVSVNPPPDSDTVDILQLLGGQSG
jgi:hypothetical protein